MDAIVCAEHIEVCSECSHLFNQITSGYGTEKTRRMQFSPETYILGDHLDYDQLSDYLDDNLDNDQAENLKSHIELCRRCSDDLKSLKEFRVSLDDELRQQRSSPGSISWIISSVRKPKLPTPVYVLGTLSVFILLGLLAFAIYRWQIRREHHPRQDHVIVIPSPQQVEKKVEDIPSLAAAVERKPKDNKSKIIDIIYDQGKLFAVSYQDDRILLSNLAPELRADAGKALQGEPITNPSMSELLSTPDPGARSSNNREGRINLTSPVGTLLIEARPVFRWKPIEGATSYVVDIVDEAFNPVAQSARLESTEWTIRQDLKRGAIYSWQVTAFKNEEKIDSKTNSIAKFMVISEKRLNKVRAARQKYRSHLEIGIYYLREGLLDEAENEFRELLTRNPESKLIAKLYQEVQNREEESIPDNRKQ